MLNTSTEKVGRIVDGRFLCKVKGYPDLFAYDQPSLQKIEKARAEEDLRIQTLRQECILQTFRESVAEYVKVYGKAPTTILMGYSDMDTLLSAYNEEQSAKTGYVRISSYSPEEKRLVDGIRIKQGCDQSHGEFRMYEFE